MAANDSAIVYVYLYKNQIDLYDLETLELKKRIVGGSISLSSRRLKMKNCIM